MERINFNPKTTKYEVYGKAVSVERCTGIEQAQSGDTWGYQDSDKATEAARHSLISHLEEMGCNYYELISLRAEAETESEPARGYSVCGPETTTRYFGVAIGIGYKSGP